MASTPAFPDLLRLIDDRSATLRSTLATAPDPHARIPSCPDWTLPDLLDHLTTVHRFWTAAVTAGEAFTPVPPEPNGELPPAAALERSEEVTAALLKALDEAGPDAACWTWWQGSGRPSTAGAVARHQVQEAAVHAHDAELAAGTPRPVPEAVALDGLDEFLAVSWGTAGPWPHPPAVVGLRTTEGPAWLVELTADGLRQPADGTDRRAATLELAGPASDLLLALHRRRPAAGLLAGGDPAVLEQLLAWPRLG
ncbi:maleylpyruvate isomerase family mycothiol-dependent enzyme [Streptomyces sp. TLI_171]|uniref:maleylpyruvate isomerase family mycothiol-dependent enzyme n=1 Tax=Streptomyces sp. TLI_171 TaxID=1938859 RepID=UPI000C1969D5|nr:maleylpyruvate isomerase family mycothiol-dependent enzyme [Streptomyces sp. TLI_171]RKE23106.1 uncharacterized protein (TIGR03083 family) [Streptomyces sp. TLI_171]